MSLMDGLRYRLGLWLHPGAHDRDSDDEMRLHLSLDAAQQRGPGIATPADAAYAARRRFGNPTFLKEERRRAAGLDLFDGLALDVRHLARSLRGAPGFAFVAILTLALGIGVTTAVVSVADHVLLRGLPFREPGRLMMMLERDDHGGFRTPSYPTAADWQRDAGAAQAFERISFVRGDGMTVRVGEDSETVGTAFVDPDFFPALGVRPARGRLLNADDHLAGAAPVAIVSHKLWLRRFGGDPAIVGRQVSIDSIPTTVVGVLPVGAVYPGFADIWQSLGQYRHMEILARRGFHADSRTIGRLRPGVDSARAAALMRTIGARLGVEYPAEQAHWNAAFFPVRDEIIGGIGPMLMTLAGAAALVLLLACANVANLLLSRVATRSRELAVRSALGASRGRVVRQLLTESLILATIGGALGTAFAAFAVTMAKKFFASWLPRTDELFVDHRVLLLAAAATGVTALLCGVWPALRAGRQRIGEVLRASALGSVGIRSESRMRRVLVTVQFALALMLLVGAGLLMQSFRRAAAVDVGFDPRGVLTLRIQPPGGAYKEPKEAAALYARLMEAARTVPGVVDAAFINHAPYRGASITTSLEIEGRSSLDSSNQVFYRTVSESYLRTMKMSVRAGRWFDAADIRSPGGSFVINESMAKRYWPGANAVGQRMMVRRASQGRADFGQPLPGTVIGVIADVHQSRQDVLPDPEVYVPYTLETWPWGNLVVRTRDGSRSIPSLSQAVLSVDGRLTPAISGTTRHNFASMEESIASSLAPRRLSVTLIVVFAVCALGLAAIGMYGVVAYSIAQRTREIGVRKALGATDGRIVRAMFRESLLLVVVGVSVGCLGAWGGARLIRGLLFDTGLVDPTTYAATIILLAGVAALATYLPARRAVRLDPVIAMRGE
jgi:predicted permease